MAELRFPGEMGNVIVKLDTPDSAVRKSTVNRINSEVFNLRWLKKLIAFIFQQLNAQNYDFFFSRCNNYVMIIFLTLKVTIATA